MRRAGLGVPIFVLCLLAGCSRRDNPQSQFVVDTPQKTIVADGVTRVLVSVRDTAGNPLPKNVSGRILENGRGRIVGIESGASDSRLAFELIPSVTPGRLTFEVQSPGHSSNRAILDTVLADGDYYRDGTPDFVRLTSAEDRAAFRHWFTLLAEEQAVHPSELAPEITDCAALLRYAYREAMRRHDAAWASEIHLGQLPAGSDIAKYAYPYTPLGPRLFRVREGTFSAADLTDGTFAEFADARTLVTMNAHLLTRDVRRLVPGDLLFFRQFGQHSPFHSMIFVGRSNFGEGDDWLVYHTGPDGKWKGEMRRTRLSTLLVHPNARWRPEISNPNFLGVYRWNILREAE